jgi:hypothetical protein
MKLMLNLVLVAFVGAGFLFLAAEKKAWATATDCSIQPLVAK